MQVTKKQFKTLLKECIKELLEEGSFNSALKEVISESLQEKRTQGRNDSLAGISTFDVMNSLRQSAGTDDSDDYNSQVPQYLNEVLGGQTKVVYEKSPLSQMSRTTSNVHQQQNNQLSRIVQQTAAQSAGSDPGRAKLMESIFADTAMTTCVLQKDDRGAGGLAGLLPNETPMSNQQLRQETQVIESLAPGGDISRWAKVAAMSMRSKKI
jgi:hypothetical protein